MSRFLFCESSNNIGGQELQILRQMEALRERGHYAALACRPSSAIAGAAKAQGLPWSPVAFRNSFHIPSIARLRALIRSERIEVALCHSGHDTNNLAIAARLTANRPILLRARTYQPGLPKALTCNVLVDRTVVPSEHLRRQILSNRAIRPDRVAVLRPMLPLSEIRAQARVPLPAALAGALANRTPVIVHAAMLRREKGHHIALEAIAGLTSRYPALRYVMAGSGPEAEELRRHAADLRLDNVVHFAGFVDSVYALLARADVVIMPSLDEPLGLSQLEALALGIPVVVSDAGGLPETVRNGETGRVLKAGDVEAWREGLADALADPARGRAMAALGRAYVESTFSPEAHLASLEAELRVATTMRE